MVATAGLVRLDELLVRRGHVPSRQQARALVLAGRVTVGSRAHPKPGLLVPEDAPLAVQDPPRYVSRGGLKLAGALERFRIDVRGRICADFGASTGGFTDCLLQHGAQRVYAIDVGHGQLHWKLRTDSRVRVLERTNARLLEGLPEPVELVTIDASFISLRLLLPVVLRIGTPDVEVVALVKPQFEAGKGRVGKGGVIRDPGLHKEVLTSFGEWLPGAGFALLGLTVSPLRGPAGNVEFLAHLRRLERSRPMEMGEGGGEGVFRPSPEGIEQLVSRALEEASELPAPARRSFDEHADDLPSPSPPKGARERTRLVLPDTRFDERAESPSPQPSPARGEGVTASPLAGEAGPRSGAGEGASSETVKPSGTECSSPSPFGRGNSVSSPSPFGRGLG